MYCNPKEASNTSIVNPLFVNIEHNMAKIAIEFVTSIFLRKVICKKCFDISDIMIPMIGKCGNYKQSILSPYEIASQKNRDKETELNLYPPYSPPKINGIQRNPKKSDPLNKLETAYKE